MTPAGLAVPGAIRRLVIVCDDAPHDDVVPLLSSGDVTRLRELRGVESAAFLAGRAALLQAAARLGAPPDELHLDATCPECGRSHGRPRLLGASDVHLSLSHAAGCAFAVAGRTAIGISASPLGNDGDGEAARRETAVRAVVKADGRGARVDPDRVRLVVGFAELDGVFYLLRSVRRRGCRVTVAQAISEASLRSLSPAARNALSGSPA
jgi:hypothetical protein